MEFYKYQGTGNDFIIIDKRKDEIFLNEETIKKICNRRLGIGADGLMLLENSIEADFRMVYYNSDGKESTMCGNGGRCIVAFAKELGIIKKNETNFKAIDGVHKAIIDNNDCINLQMNDVSAINFIDNHVILNTGSPHYVVWINVELETFPVLVEGRKIRNHSDFKPNGINVNFAHKHDEELWVRTYERGVEEETLSCGTGVTAVAIADVGLQTGDFQKNIHTLGGDLQVKFTKNNPFHAINIWLSGPAIFVYKGVI